MLGGLDAETERYIMKCVASVMPNAEVEPLNTGAPKGALRRALGKPDCPLIVVSADLVATKDLAGLVTGVSKVHVYKDRQALSEYMASTFGVDASVSESEETPVAEVTVEMPEVTVSSAPADLNFGYSTEFEATDELVSLQKELADAKALIEELTHKTADSDVPLLTERIHALMEEVEGYKAREQEARERDLMNRGKVSKAEEAIDENDKLREELNKQRSASAKFEYERTQLQSRIKELEGKLSEVAPFRGKYEKSAEEVEKLSAELKRAVAKYEGMQDDLSTLQKKVEGQATELKEAGKTLTEAMAEKEDLEKQLTAARNDHQSVLVEKASLEKKLTEAMSKQTGVESQLSGVIGKLEAKAKQLNEVEARLTETASKLTEADNERSNLEEQLTGVISKLEARAKELKSEAERREGVEVKLEAEAKKRAEVEKQLSEVMSKLESKSETATAEADSLRAEIDKLNGRIRKLTDDAESTKGTGKELADALKRVDELEMRCELLEAEADEKGKEALEVKKRLDAANAGVSERDGVIANLKSQLEMQKVSEDDVGTTTALRLKIVDLQDELAKAQHSANQASTEELDKLRTEVENLRDANEELTLDVADKTEQLSELMGSVFTRMSNSAMPRTTLSAKVCDLQGEYPNMTVVAGGSAESNLHAYKALQATCNVMNTDEHTVILDLSSDSYIDSEFKIKAITSPISWLIGTEEAKNFLADTQFKGVKALSIGLAYSNPLFLLNVDWNARLAELAKLGARVVIYVGTLDGVVAQMLFQMFSEAMRSLVVIRATPINMRTVMLNLAGLGTPKAEIMCMGYQSSSQGMYKKLASQYKTKVMLPTDTLPLA